MKTRTIVFLIIFYLIGGFLTNSYIRLHRWEDWEKQAAKHPHADSSAIANITTLVTTTVWPIYVLSRLSDEVIQLRVQRTNFIK